MMHGQTKIKFTCNDTINTSV